MTKYDDAFFSYLQTFALRSARRVVPVVQRALPVQSVADFGCGHGAWLYAWREAGAGIAGVDGSYVNQNRLLVPRSAFTAADLAAPLDLGRRFDLAQSLEVAEHLPPASAEQFVDTLSRHANAVLFSAAVPGQGGEHHVNERPLSFWRSLFARRGYHAVDWVRPAVAGDPAVQRWYQCNTILYVNDAGAERLSPAARNAIVPGGQPLDTRWSGHERVRHAIVRTLPLAVVNRLSALNARVSARRAAPGPAMP